MPGANSPTRPHNFNFLASVDKTLSNTPPEALTGINAGILPGDGLGAIDLPDLGFNLEKVNMPRKKALPPVELVESIFRAYDIRGIVVTPKINRGRRKF